MVLFDNKLNNGLTINFGRLNQSNLTTDTTISWNCPCSYTTDAICFACGDRLSNTGWQSVKYRLDSLTLTNVKIEVVLNGTSGSTFTLYIIGIGY